MCRIGEPDVGTDGETPVTDDDKESDNRVRTMMLASQIEWILLITGLATAGALVLFLAPVPMMKMLFGQAPSDALSLLIARHWGLLVCLVGGLLTYAAYHAEIRVPTLTVAIV